MLIFNITTIFLLQLFNITLLLLQDNALTDSEVCVSFLLGILLSLQR